MVFSSGGDVEGAVNLFEHHNAREMVREGHGGHGQAQVCGLLECFVHAAGAADQHADARDAAARDGGDAVGKSLGSKNRLNVVKATMNALMKLRSEDEIKALRA